MSFYFPIMINARRLHICHLQARGKVNGSNGYWSFIINTEKSGTIMSINSDSPVLLSSEGTKTTRQLNHSWTFVVSKDEESMDGFQTYRVALKTGGVKGQHGQATGLVVTGIMGNEEDPISLTADPTILGDADGKIEPMRIVLEYESQGVVYEDSFVCYFSRNEVEVSAALDFGSEASQLRFAGVNGNNNLVGTFESMLGLPTSDPDREYWQGEPSDELFKSVFWIRRNPIKTCYGDAPMKIGDKPFVTPLISVKENPNVYEEMELLPNLKLVELSQGADAISFGHELFSFPQGSDIRFAYPTLADQQMRSSVLRVILNNFLHAILANVNRAQTDKYVRLVVMAPNVYYQTKVFEMMKGLYLDFDAIRRNGDYPYCKGFEVQVVSESDAAFIGARTCMRRVVNIPNGYFLNIDSGKGTTDFSIVQQQPSLGKFNSLYRDGIPAAGNVITYAYYEALYDFMKAYGMDIQPWIAGAPKASLISFMSYLEEFKKQPVTSMSLYFEKPLASNITSLQDLNRYLSRNLGRVIPGVEKYVSKKVDILISSLVQSIEYYMEVNKCVFSQVILSGRALLCQAYKDKLIETLIAKGWIKSDKDVFWVTGNRAKTCCLAGALAIEGQCSVNYNSGLIGSPLLYRTEDNSDTFFARMQRRFFSQKKYTRIDMPFFYEGSESICARNVTLRLGGRFHSINSNEKDDKKVYFLGEAFASQIGDGKLQLIESNNLTFEDDSFDTLVNQSLFPYYPGSAALPVGKYFDHENEKTILDNTGKLVGSAAPASSAAPAEEAAATETPAATTSTTTATEGAKNPTPPIEDDGLGDVL